MYFSCWAWCVSYSYQIIPPENCLFLNSVYNFTSKERKMKICKNCGAENEDDSKICKVCGESFKDDSFEWVLLLISGNQFEADVVSGLLEANGINVMMKRPGAGYSISSPFSNPLLGGAGQFNVFVMKNDLEKALAILKAENVKIEEEESGNDKNVDG
jgi:ribosomal protein L40E